MKNTLTLRHRADLSPHYFTILESMRPWLKKPKQRGILLVPFVLTCAATLECLLNDRLIQHCLETYGSGDYRRYADRLTGLSIRAKLDFVIPLLSGDKYAIRSDSTTYANLIAMIALRNSLTHNKSFLKEYEAEILEVEFDGTPLIAYPGDILKPISAEDLVSIKPEPYHDSLVDLDKLLEYPYSFGKNKLVRRISITV